MTTGREQQRGARGRAADRRACGRWLRSLRRVGRHVERPRADLARCTNSTTAGDAATTPARLRPTGRKRRGPAMKFVFDREPQRRAARRDDSQHRAALGSGSTLRAAAATICSKLSRSSRVGRWPIRETMPSRSVRSSASLTSSPAASVGRNAAGSETSASVMNARASGNSAPRSRPSSISARVFRLHRTDDRDHPLRSHEISEGGELAGAPDERHRRSGRLLGRFADRSPFPSSALASGTTKPSPERQTVRKHARVFSLTAQRHRNDVASVLDLLVRRVRQQTPPGRRKTRSARRR